MISRFVHYVHHELYWAGWPHHWWGTHVMNRVDR